MMGVNVKLDIYRANAAPLFLSVLLTLLRS
jgi:hypothetical protein